MQLVDRYRKEINDNSQVILWEGSFDSQLQNITLSDNIFNYDMLLFNNEQSGMYFVIPMFIIQGNTIQRSGGVNSTAGNITIALDKCSKDTNIVEVHAEYIPMSTQKGSNVRFQKVIGVKL